MPHRPTERLPELRAILEMCSGRGELLYHQETPWSAATFCGARHTIALRFTGAEAFETGEQLLSALPSAEIVLPGKLVADISVVSTLRRAVPTIVSTIILEMLILEEG